MKLMPCPLNGARNISEFVCAGEVTAMPDPVSGSDAEWADYLYMQTNARGVVKEWWLHVPTSYWFIAERNTETDEIVRTYAADEVFTERVEFKPRESGQ